jgi:hypothetical protein
MAALCRLKYTVPFSVSDVLNYSAARRPTAPENVRCADDVRQSLGHIDVHHQIAGISVTALRRNQIGAPIKPLR